MYHHSNLVGLWILANSVAKILVKVGNGKTLALFSAMVVAEQKNNSRALREKLKLTRSHST